MPSALVVSGAAGARCLAGATPVPCLPALNTASHSRCRCAVCASACAVVSLCAAAPVGLRIRISGGVRQGQPLCAQHSNRLETRTKEFNLSASRFHVRILKAK